MEFIKQIVEKQQLFFSKGETKKFDFRIRQLKKLKRVLLENEDQLYEMIYKDFKKSEFETFSNELLIIYHEIDLAVRNLKKWGRKKSVKTNLFNWLGKSFIRTEPYGVTLVIGAWNYPYQLSLCPAIASIAAGNTVIIKPSELTSNSSEVMAKLIHENFDPGFFAVVEGAVPETTALLEQKFDKIFFTGSSRVGKIVYEAAAQNLTPVTLELGGKSPVIVAKDCNLDRAVQRIVWGKYLNSGQTCLSPDYILVERSVHSAFLEKVKAKIESNQYSIENGNCTQIINSNSFDRLIALIEPDKVYCGGQFDRESLFIAPTVLQSVDLNDSIMEEEIFGPIMPVLVYDKIEDALSIIKNKPKPLALYVFSNSRKIQDLVFDQISFGGGCVNDVVMHIANSNLPFSGVGASGMGSYHGEFGFLTFSHQKGILRKNNLLELSVKHSPYSIGKLKWIKRLAKLN